MIALYRLPHGSGISSEGETVIPAGTPYLAKVKGELVMARHKRDTKIRAVAIKRASGTITTTFDLTRPMEVALDFLGEAFGIRGRKPRKRAKSFDRPSPSSIDTSLSYVPHLPLAYSTPLPQRAFSTMSSFPPMPILQQPIQYAVAPPHSADPYLDQLRCIDAHYRSISGEGLQQIGAATPKGQGLDSKKTSISKHTCANCGMLRSKRYYSDHPIKPGEIPVQGFCGKCQRNVSSTGSSSSDNGSSSSSRHDRKKKKTTARKHNKGKGKRSSSQNGSSQSQELSPRQNSRYKENVVESEPSSACSKTQCSDHKAQKKIYGTGNSSVEDSKVDLVVSPVECSYAAKQVRGRTRPPTVESDISARTSLPSAARSHPQSSQPGARHERYDTPPPPQSRQGQNFDPNRESSMHVYQYTQAHPGRPQPHKQQESYEQRGSLRYDEEECSHGRRDSSHESKIQGGNSIRSALSSGVNSFESSYRSKKSVQTPQYDHGSKGKKLSSQHKEPNVLRSWSKDKLESEAGSREELSRKDGYPGDHYTAPAKHYTHYQGDWAFDKPSRGIKSDRYNYSEPSSSDDGVGYAKSNTSSFSNLPPAPTPPSHLPRSWSAQQHGRASPADETHSSGRNGNLSQYQEAFGVGPTSDSSEHIPYIFSGTSAKLDPFYAAVNTVIDGEINDKENTVKARDMKHVTFRNAESGVESAEAWAKMRRHRTCVI